MSEIPDRNTLLDDIEVRQDDLLRQLDELNGRIEVVLREQSAAMGIPYKGAKSGSPSPGQPVSHGQPAAPPASPVGQPPSVAAIQMSGLVDGPQQPQSEHQADEAA